MQVDLTAVRYVPEHVESRGPESVGFDLLGMEAIYQIIRSEV